MTSLRPARRLIAASAGAALLLSTLAAPAQAAATWQVGVPPLATPWTSKVSPSNALPEYPRPQMTRDKWQNLNGVWEFAKAETGQAVPAGKTLDERVLVPYPIESALSGIQRHEDRMWYRRTFTVPAGWKVGSANRLRMHFGAVDYDAKIYVNGTQVATHRGGYDGFDVDVTDALKGTGPQELIVWAEDLTDGTGQPIGKQRKTPDKGIFYQGSSGIWRTVWMEPTPAASIADLKITPSVKDGVVRIKADIAGSAAGLTLKAAVKGGAVGSGAANTELTIPMPKAKLWSPDNPYLYDLKVQLLDGRKTTVDQVGSYFGMRDIGTAKGADGRLRMTLNGKVLFQMANLDQGFWPDGLNTAPTDAALKWDLQQDKVMGFNTVRKHIKVEPDRWYYWADKLGLLVWQDMPAANTGPIPAEWRDQYQAELKEMVREHQSWTSIIGWVPMNEGWGEWDKDATGAMADAVKAQDPTRLVNAHSGVNCCNSKGDSGKGDVIDFHQYPGPGSPVPSETRVAIDGEHGGYGLKVSNHMWFGDGQAYEMTPTKEALTAKYVSNQEDVLKAAQQCGISGAIYTQLTDVEAELNGFFTYDRQVTKMDLKQVKAINQKIIKDADKPGATGPAPNPGTPGLTGIAYWPLDGSFGSLAAVGSPAFVDGKKGQAVSLDGSTQYLDAGKPVLNTTGSYSAAAWVKLDKADGAFQTLVSQDGPSQSDFFLQYSGADQKFAMSFAGVRSLANFKPEVGKWYHLVGVNDAAKGELKLYVDGAPASTKVTGCLSTVKPTGNTVIGRGKFNGGPVDYLDGTIDQVHLYDRALSDSEIKSLYDSGE